MTKRLTEWLERIVHEQEKANEESFPSSNLFSEAGCRVATEAGYSNQDFEVDLDGLPHVANDFAIPHPVTQLARSVISSIDEDGNSDEAFTFRKVMSLPDMQVNPLVVDDDDDDATTYSCIKLVHIAPKTEILSTVNDYSIGGACLPDVAADSYDPFSLNDFCNKSGLQ